MAVRRGWHQFRIAGVQFRVVSIGDIKVQEATRNFFGPVVITPGFLVQRNFWVSRASFSALESASLSWTDLVGTTEQPGRVPTTTATQASFCRNPTIICSGQPHFTPRRAFISPSRLSTRTSTFASLNNSHKAFGDSRSI